MPAAIPARLADLLSRECRALASLALTLHDGTPHVTPVWFDYDGATIVLNTARGRVKDRVLQRRPVVALLIMDPADPYRYLIIRGPVVDETEEGGYEMICRLNEKYEGKFEFPKVPGQVRVTYKVSPEHVYPKA